MRPGLGRSVLRVALPVSLLERLEIEAARRGIASEALIDQLIVERLPAALAEAAEARLRHSLSMTRPSASSARGPTCSHLDGGPEAHHLGAAFTRSAKDHDKGTAAM